MNPKGFTGMEVVMKNRFITSSAILLSGLTLLYAQETNLLDLVMTADDADTNSTNAVKPAEHLMYIIPKDQLEIHGWGNVDLQGEDMDAKEESEAQPGVKIYRIEDFKTTDEPHPFSELFGTDWIIIKAVSDESLYKLIATSAPEESARLPPIRIDSSKYKLEEVLTEPTWPEGSVPKRILMKWAVWWQSETNAKPVVLILLDF